MRDVVPAISSLLAGTILWTATAIVGGRAEPWDTGLFWSAAYPAALAIAIVLGFLFPDRPWRWAALLVAGSQLVVMAVFAPSLGLLPLGLVMLGLLALPAVLVAAAAARLRRALT